MRTAGRLIVALIACVAAASPAAAEHVSPVADDGAIADDARPVSSPAELDAPRAAPPARREPPPDRRVAIAAPAARQVAAGAPSFHVVEPGQTLSSIGRLHGCAVAALVEANRLDSALIRPGQQLRIPPCAPGTRLPPIALIAGQSLGQPWNGSLRDGTALPPGEGYFIRRPQRAFGASHMVSYIARAIAAVRTRFPAVHTLAIGDLSAKKGGAITEHRSHQSGRDVDIGLYYRVVPRGYPRTFVAAGDNLDCAATWALLHAFARTADDPAGVTAIFLDFGVQGQLYTWALDHGVPADYLARLFQYPHGEGAMIGLVRHEPNHADHMHVRFRCPPGDAGCS